MWVRTTDGLYNLERFDHVGAMRDDGPGWIVFAERYDLPRRIGNAIAEPAPVVLAQCEGEDDANRTVDEIAGFMRSGTSIHFLVDGS